MSGVSAVNPADLLKRYVLPNMPYLLVFWFANKLGMAYRIAPGDDLLRKLMGTMETLGIALSSLMPSFDLFDLAVGAVGTAVIYGIVYSK